MALGPYPEFSWSFSRSRTFEFCVRQYYHQYYGSWGGWDAHADERCRLTYDLNKRPSLPMWGGSAVHDGIAAYLRGAGEMDAIIASTREQMREQYGMSMRGNQRRTGRDKWFGLIEHHYDGQIDRDRVRANWDHVESCLLAFQATPYKDDYLAAKQAGRFSFSDDPVLTSFEDGKLEGHGLGRWPLFARPDLVVEGPDGRIMILDWKTGTPPRSTDGQGVTLQLSVYLLWVLKRMNLKLEGEQEIEAYEHYLPGGEKRGGQVTADHIERARAHIRGSVDQMRALLADVDQNIAREADFPAQGTARKCATCAFRAVCDERVAGEAG